MRRRRRVLLAVGLAWLLPACGGEVQCVRALVCVQECGGEVVASGCEPCPQGSFDDIACRADGGG